MPEFHQSSHIPGKFMLQPAGFSQLNHLADSLIHCSFFSASSTNMKELERVHKGNAWQIAGVALVLPHTKQKSFSASETNKPTPSCLWLVIAQGVVMVEEQMELWVSNKNWAAMRARYSCPTQHEVEKINLKTNWPSHSLGLMVQ